MAGPRTAFTFRCGHGKLSCCCSPTLQQPRSFVRVCVCMCSSSSNSSSSSGSSSIFIHSSLFAHRFPPRPRGGVRILFSISRSLFLSLSLSEHVPATLPAPSTSLLHDRRHCDTETTALKSSEREVEDLRRRMPPRERRFHVHFLPFSLHLQ